MGMNWTYAHALWDDTARDIFNPAFNGGYAPDLSVLSDDEILLLCDEDLKRDFDFLADMSDSPIRRDSELRRNDEIHGALIEEARRRSLI